MFAEFSRQDWRAQHEVFRAMLRRVLAEKNGPAFEQTFLPEVLKGLDFAGNQSLSLAQLEKLHLLKRLSKLDRVRFGQQEKKAFESLKQLRIDANDPSFVDLRIAIADDQKQNPDVTLPAIQEGLRAALDQGRAEAYLILAHHKYYEIESAQQGPPAFRRQDLVEIVDWLDRAIEMNPFLTDALALRMKVQAPLDWARSDQMSPADAVATNNDWTFHYNRANVLFWLLQRGAGRPDTHLQGALQSEITEMRRLAQNRRSTERFCSRVALFQRDESAERSFITSLADTPMFDERWRREYEQILGESDKERQRRRLDSLWRSILQQRPRTAPRSEAAAITGDETVGQIVRIQQDIEHEMGELLLMALIASRMGGESNVDALLGRADAQFEDHRRVLTARHEATMRAAQPGESGFNPLPWEREWKATIGFVKVIAYGRLHSDNAKIAIADAMAIFAPPDLR